MVRLIPVYAQAKEACGLRVKVFHASNFHRRFRALKVSFPPLFVTSNGRFRARQFKVSRVNARLSPLKNYDAINGLSRIRNVLRMQTRFSGKGRFITFMLTKRPTTRCQRELYARIFARRRVFMGTGSMALRVVQRDFVLRYVIPTVFIREAILCQARKVLPLVANNGTITFSSTTAKGARCSKVRIVRNLCRINARSVLALLPDIRQRRESIIRVCHALHLRRGARAQTGVNGEDFRRDHRLLPFATFRFRFLLRRVLSIKVRRFSKGLR